MIDDEEAGGEEDGEGGGVGGAALGCRGGLNISVEKHQRLYSVVLRADGGVESSLV